MLQSIATLILVLCPLAAQAQGRPSDEEIFGAQAPQRVEQSQSPATRRPTESDLFGEPSSAQPVVTPELRPKDDALEIGGQIYLRGEGQWQQDVPPADWFLTAPALVDGYLDVRPNDRVRGFLLARLNYDLSRSTSQTSNPEPGTGSSALFGSPQNPQMVLDQLWINFDIGHTVFVTAGKQHVKWGTGRFWNPTDFLHPVRRDPLAAFDSRTGQTMVKLHLPWEKRGWNLYGMAVFDESQPNGRLGSVGGAARAELVLGNAELGLDGLVRQGQDARFGIDFSAGIWDLDVHGEAALRKGSDIPLWRLRSQPTTPLPAVPGLRDFYETYQPGFTPQIVGGLSWSWKYSDEDTLTLGGEYFYNGAGYGDEKQYLVALAGQALENRTYYVPFYLGKHYAGAYLMLPKPGSWNDSTFTLSTIGNLSDRTFVTRLDYSVRLLTYLTLEAYLAGHYGRKGGEFRLAVDLPGGVVPELPQGFHLAPPVLDFGMGLKVNL